MISRSFILLAIVSCEMIDEWMNGFARKLQGIGFVVEPVKRGWRERSPQKIRGAKSPRTLNARNHVVAPFQGLAPTSAPVTRLRIFATMMSEVF
jgi:hypothetical protein